MATSSPYVKATEYTETFNEHWVEEGRPSPYEPFPSDRRLLEVIFDVIELERIVFIEKSRDLMVSWACVAYFTLQVMRTSRSSALFQTQKYDKVVQLIEYAKCLYRRQPDWLKEAFPLAKPIDRQPKNCLEFAHGGYILGIPGGANQLRGYHPWGYLNDETSFQPEAGECFNEALSAVKGKIVLNSSAGPGWYADVRRDIVRNEEE